MKVYDVTMESRIAQPGGGYFKVTERVEAENPMEAVKAVRIKTGLNNAVAVTLIGVV